MPDQPVHGPLHLPSPPFQTLQPRFGSVGHWRGLAVVGLTEVVRTRAELEV